MSADAAAQSAPARSTSLASGQLERPARVRVCLVGPSLDILGGQAIQADRLLQRLRELPGIDASFLPVNPRLPGPLRRLQSIKYVRTIVTSVRYLASLVTTIPRCDVVHAFSASYWSFLLAPLPAMVFGRLFGKRVVLNYRSGEADDHLARWPISAWAMRLAHAIVVPSGYLVDVFARYGLRATSIFNFVDPERIPFRARPRPRPTFLSNRNFEALYNIPCTLRAFARIQRALPEAELILAGDGTDRARLQRMVEELGIRQVRFVGRKPPSEMARLYDEADVYLNTPNIDNMPGSVLEAFAAGIPVVTTDAGGIPYIVAHERTGLVVPRDDDEALAQAALRVVNEPGLADRLTSAARRTCLDAYTWEAVGDAWGRLYRGLAGRTVAASASPAGLL